ncbi:hypothetical protein SCLCIDRAFT_870343 [Scleroderma citrinum Foug A]|uniref:Uncharacterized protein n=1 Tax=Scleroderma citrinum Foug A TaxID=1036808 RepID=A0A0C3DZZ7_9AGAM|nr:hypothetical protein SCLCIDRAFT_870343 [Scleroderma citrinum Foug A]
MVWHAYLPNPSWYAEDTIRIPILGTLAKYNRAMSTCLRTEVWRLRTRTPYHPFDAAAKLTHKSVKCLQCTRSLSVAFLDTDGVGYSQENFKAACRCGFHITMDYLGVYKFVKNIFEQNPPASYLAYVFYPIPSQTLSFIEFMYSSFLLLSPLHFDITEGRCTRPTTRMIPRVLRR